MPSAIAPEELERVAAIVREHPGGVAPVTVRGALKGENARRDRVIDEAVARGVVFRGTRYLPAGRGVGRRRVGALFPLPPASPAGDSLSPAELRERRLAAGVQQEALAERLGVSRPLVALWEAGERPIPGGVADAVAVALAQGPRPSGRTPEEFEELVEEAVAVVVEAVRGFSDGVSRTKLCASTTRHDAAFRLAIDRALEQQRIYEAVTGPGGGRRRLHVRQPAPPLTGEELARRRCGLGWTQTELGALARVPSGLISGYECGRPIPTAKRQRLLEALAAAEAQALAIRRRRPKYRRARGADQQPAASDIEALALPASWEEVTRLLGARFRGRPGRELLEHWLSTGQVHEFEELAEMRKGRYEGRWPRRMVGAGPKPPVRPMTGAQLAERRRAAGLGRPELAALVGVSHSRLSAWENGEPFSEAWVREFERVLSKAGPAAVPHEDPKHTEDGELRRRALELIAERPGELSATQLTMELPGDVRRRWAMLRALEAEGEVHTEKLRYLDATGRRWQTKQVYQLGAGIP